MQRKLASYLLLSFLSFSVSTTLFHTVANAQTIDSAITAPVPTPSPTSFLQDTTPSRTLPPAKFRLQSITHPTPTVTPPAAKPEPTVTVTPTKEPTPTIAPTAVPSPTATPTPQATVTSPAELDAHFDKYASEYGVDKEDLKRIAKCEAGFNSQADTGLYAGMYQFHAETWASTRNAMGLDPNPDLRKNAEESIRTAAFKIKNGGRGAWPNC